MLTHVGSVLSVLNSYPTSQMHSQLPSVSEYVPEYDSTIDSSSGRVAISTFVCVMTSSAALAAIIHESWQDCSAMYQASQIQRKYICSNTANCIDASPSSILRVGVDNTINIDCCITLNVPSVVPQFILTPCSLQR